MTPSTIELVPTPEDSRVARHAAAAIALTVAEAAIPLPLPGVKPGLGNIVTLVFLAPGFFLSLAGAVLSLAVLAVARHLPPRWFGPVSQSILAAIAHITGQLIVARLWLVPHDGVFYLVPVFALAAVFFGTINGLIAARLLDGGAPEAGRGRPDPGQPSGR